MKRLIPVLLILVCLCAVAASRRQFFLPKATPPASSDIAVSDDFTDSNSDSLGTDSLGGTWVEVEGDTDIVSNEAVAQTAIISSCLNICGTSLSTTTTYIRVNEDSGAEYPSLVVRWTDASSPYYIIKIDYDNGQITWEQYDSLGGSGEVVQQTSTSQFTGGASVVWALTITGTGNDTIIRIWKDPTNNTPTAIDGWDSGGDTADWSFTNNPTSPVNTGGKCGFGGWQLTAGTLQWDDFYAGDL